MKRLLFAVLWIVVILFVVQIIYFVFFSVRAPRYNDGQPLNIVTVSSPIHRVSALYQNGSGFAWVGTDGEGLYRFDVDKNESYPVSIPHELLKMIGRNLDAARTNGR